MGFSKREAVSTNADSYKGAYVITSSTVQVPVWVPIETPMREPTWVPCPKIPWEPVRIPV